MDKEVKELYKWLLAKHWSYPALIRRGQLIILLNGGMSVGYNTVVNKYGVK